MRIASRVCLLRRRPKPKTVLHPPTFETEPLHFQLPPTKNLRPDMRDALEVKPRAACAGALAAADAAAANMFTLLNLQAQRHG